MNRDKIITALRAHQSELKAAGVLSASIFGSTARGEASGRFRKVAHYRR